MGSMRYLVLLVGLVASYGWAALPLGNQMSADEVLNKLARALKAIAQAPAVPKKPQEEPIPPSILVSQEDWERMTLKDQATYISLKLKEIDRLHKWDRRLLNRRRSEVVSVIFANSSREILTLFSKSFDLAGAKISERFPHIADLADLIIHFDRILGEVLDENYLVHLRQVRNKMKCLGISSKAEREKVRVYSEKTQQMEFICQKTSCVRFDECVTGFLDDAVRLLEPFGDALVGGYRAGGREVTGALEMIVGTVAPDSELKVGMKDAAAGFQNAIALLKDARRMILITPDTGS